MTGFCVILSGRLQGDKDDASVWAPLKLAFNLDDASFAQRVLAAVPLIVRQNLDEPGAADLVEKLVASGIDAVVLQDDAQLAYFERKGSRRGPVPRSGLAKFIRPHERYRLRGERESSFWVHSAAIDEPSDAKQAPYAVAAQADENRVPVPAHSDAPSLPSTLSEASDPAVVPTAAMAPGEHAVAGTLPLPVEPPSTVDDGFEDDFDPEIAEDAVEGSASAQMPSGERSLALESEQTAPASRSRAGILIAVAVIVAIAAASFAWSRLKHQAGQVTPTGVPASAPTPASLPAPESSAAHASTAQLPSSTSTTASAPANAAATQASESSNPPAPAAVFPAVASAASPPSLQHVFLLHHCEARGVNPQAPEEVTLLANGKNHLTGRSVRAGKGGELFIVEAALGYDGACRPSPFQVYVFRHGTLAGTLSPQPMQALTDGAISSFKLIDAEHLQVEIAHYKPGDSACCASSQEERVVDLQQFFGAKQAAAPIEGSVVRSGDGYAYGQHR